MTEKYQYKGRDLTTLVLAKVEHVVSIIAGREEMAFDDAYLMFIQSTAFKNLTNLDTLTWSESAEYIADDYYRERA